MSFAQTTALVLGTLLLTGISTSSFARSLYLNGMDISSSRNETLKNVNLRIDENGNIYIEAPHYQVQEEKTYAPLSSWIQGVNQPKHTTRGEMAAQLRKVGKTKAAPKAGQAGPIKTGDINAPANVKTSDKAGTEKAGSR